MTRDLGADPSRPVPYFSWNFFLDGGKCNPMEGWRHLLDYLRENILHNPILWGIAAVVLWIIGSAFLKAWRGKDEE
jgi:hypothetical protein